MRRGFTLREITVILALLGAAVWIFLPWGHLGSSRHNKWRWQCQTNLRQIALAVKQYVHDNDERFPSLATVASWRDALTPYQKNAEVFHCPSVEGDREARSTDYWFNARLSGVKEEILEVQSLTVMLGDGYSTTDSRVAISQLPQSWITDPKSPARRHLDGLNFAFADGHVKWLKPDKITIDTTKNMNVTFAIR